MSRYMDVKSYFMERASESGQSAETHNRVVDILVQNGVKTMRELCEKSVPWFSGTFREKTIYELAMKTRDEYYSSAYYPELLAAGEDLTKTYFNEHAPADMESVRHRAILALCRTGINTMSALCAVSPGEIERIRNMGAKSVALALLMREEYIAENGLPVTHTVIDGDEVDKDSAQKE